MNISSSLIVMALLAGVINGSALQVNRMLDTAPALERDNAPAESIDQRDAGTVVLDRSQVLAADVVAKNCPATIPASAVIWFAGSAWIYTRVDATTFRRKPIAILRVDEHGALGVRRAPQDRQLVVVRGAQVLLAEERKSTAAFEAD